MFNMADRKAELRDAVSSYIDGFSVKCISYNYPVPYVFNSGTVNSGVVVCGGFLTISPRYSNAPNPIVCCKIFMALSQLSSE